jgi:Iodothyronine deiodinase
VTTEPISPAAEHYNITGYYREIHRGDRRAYAGQPLRVGMTAPGFRLTALDGGVADLDELRRDGHVVVLFGCYSAPPCVRELPVIDRMAARRLPGFRFQFVYTREIHPNEDLPQGRFPHHRTLDDKIAAARMLQKDLGLQIPVAVDDLAGTTHLAYGGLPFCAAVVRRDGILVHREEWASADQLGHVLANLAQADERLAAGQQPRLSLSETLWNMERLDKKP